MPLERELTADEFQESFRAERMLAELDVHEELAALHDEETDTSIRNLLAKRYRRVLGIAPERRDELRSVLATIERIGRPTVAGVLQTLNGPSCGSSVSGGGGDT